MQNFNSFLVVSALAALAFAAPAIQAQDTEAQAKARQALREKLGQLDKTTPIVVDTEAQAKAREALRKEIERIEAEGPVKPASAQSIEEARQATRQKLDELSVGSQDSPEVAKARAALRNQTGSHVGAFVAAPTAGAQAHTAAQKAAVVDAEKAEAAAQAERRAKRNANLAPGAFQPIEGPAIPLSNEKQQRLAELLQKYRADQIGPEEYHQERAKILAAQ
jgi:hypothetical protein